MRERLSRIEWKTSLKTGLAAGIALFLAIYLTEWLKRPDVVVSGLWTTLAALVVQQSHLGSTYRTAWMRVLGVILGCFMGGLFTTLLGSNPFSVTVSIFLTAVLCSFFYIKDSARIACLSVAAVMVMWGLKPESSPWTFAFYRFADTCLGVAVALVVAHVLWPAEVTSKIGKSLATALRTLDSLYQLGSKLQPLTNEELKEFRTISHKMVELLWSSRQILEDSKLELLSQFSSLEEWKLLYFHLDLTFERIAALRRVSKEQLNLLTDEPLIKNCEALIDATHRAFEELAQTLEIRNAAPVLSYLENAKETLSADLLRLRNSRPTRTFELRDVEGYYVFFYSLRSIATDLLRICDHITDLQTAEAKDF